MLYGELPFDEENINTMFKYIKEAKYFMKGVASHEAKDLLNRMIQPNPFRRITMSEIITHPWFDIKVSKYLLDPYKNFSILTTTTVLDQEIVDQLMLVDLGLNIDSRKEIEESVIKGDIPHYDYLKHAKMLIDIKSEDKQTLKVMKFTKTCHLNKKCVRVLNIIYKGLEDIRNAILLQTAIEEGRPRKELNSKSRIKSFNTNSSSTAYIKDAFRPENLKNKVGFIYRTNMNVLFKNIFLKLKEMKIVWKKWNSDYIYKCQTGIPKSEEKDIKAKINDRINEFYENDMLKFFLHFTQVPRKKEVIDFENK
jgi:serine/threonine protein kinase